MGTVFEELIRKFAELSNETAGEHLASLNPGARLIMYGQELNAESCAICKADNRRSPSFPIRCLAILFRPSNLLEA